jgi:tetratricopeptide (TPR) repeat protein
MARRLSTAEVSRILGLREGRVRELVRAGLCKPARSRRGYAFSFQDLVVLRAAKELLERQISGARLRRAIAALAAELPEDRPLSGLRIFADGREVAVRDGHGSWQPATGQTVLDFEVDELTRRAEEITRPPEPSRGEAALDRALELEDEDPVAAAAAYREALAQDPELVDAYVNLGRLAHEAGDPREAARLDHLALERSPDDPIVHFNLALALEDLGSQTAAVAHYRRALELDPDFADAHWNLGTLCERLGRETDAVRHYHAYKKLTEG